MGDFDFSVKNHLKSRKNQKNQSHRRNDSQSNIKNSHCEYLHQSFVFIQNSRPGCGERSSVAFKKAAEHFIKLETQSLNAC